MTNSSHAFYRTSLMAYWGKGYHVFFMVILGLMATRADSHNGTYAFAYPVEGVHIDGDFKDWPSDIPTYPISHYEYGDASKSKEDLRAQFRIGYNTSESSVYIAVEVRDESVITDESSSWDQQDGCELYIATEHVNTGAVIQFARYGNHNIRSFASNERDVEVGVTRTDSTLFYEWRIDIDKVDPRRSIGFDIAIDDKDQDGSFSWVTWGRGTQKTSSIARCGDLLFVNADAKMGEVTGRIEWKSPSVLPLPTLVQIHSREDPKLIVSVPVDSMGFYKATLPSGPYAVFPSEAVALRIEEVPWVRAQVEGGKKTRADRLQVTTVFPGREWQYYAIPEHAGYSAEKIRALLQTIGEKSNTTGLLVVVGGKILVEYGDVKELSYIASVRKSVLAMLYGKYVENGKIKLDKTLEQLYIDDNGGLLPIEKQATVYHLITARSGIYHPASNPGDDSAGAPKRGSKEPGEYMLYNNWDFNVAGAVFEIFTGRDIYEALGCV